MKDVEIGTLGETKCYMKLDELFRIANKEVQDFADNVCRDNSRLQYKLDLAVEALRFYADSDCYEKFGGDGLSEIEEDGGELAQKVLEEIEE